MLGNFLDRRLKKHTCQVALALGQACGGCHLAPSAVLELVPQAAVRLALGRPWGRRRSLLFQVPLHSLSIPSERNVGPWTCQSLIWRWGLPWHVYFHSFGVRDGMSTGWEISILKQLEPSLLPLSFFFENKRKQGNTY